MPKTITNKFQCSLTFEKMYEAYERAKIGKMKKAEVLEFEYNLELNLISLIEKLKNNQYQIGEYRQFKVHEPKERVIKALPFRDRVVHQWYVYEFIIPYIVPKFIYDSYACLKEKGTHSAVKRLKYFIDDARKKWDDFYIIKMDISKFFYNIDPNILFEIMKKYIHDSKLLELTSVLIFDRKDEIGIPIGNYTSQYFANIYLNELDQYIKQVLKIKYYLRYMDDFVLLVPDKDTARKIYKQIEIFVNEKLRLKLNPKSRIYPSAMGVDFCGYRVYYTHILVRDRCKRDMRKRIRKWNYHYKKGILNKKEVEMSLNSWLSHIKHADSYNLHTRYLNKMEFKL